VSLLKTIIFKVKSAILAFIKRLFTREVIANLLMLCFILNTAIGAALIYGPAGFIVAGIGCGIVGFLLGLE
jgi:hypothetical protein